MVSQIDKPPIRFRILIVDNEPTPREINEFTVSDLGLEPVVALGEERALLEDAKLKAQQKRCHLALVDMRLVKDSDPNDESGIELISSFPEHMFSIVVSGSDDDGQPRVGPESMDQARERGAVGYVGKGDNETLIEKIQKTLRQQWNWALNYDFAKSNVSPEQILVQLDLPRQVPPDEIDSVLRRSFNKGEQGLVLESMEDPYMPDSSLSFRRSVVFFVDAYDRTEDAERHEIVKFAPRDHIIREYENYREFVRRLQHQYTALIERKPVVSWDIGMIRYTDETTGGRERFTEWYAKANYEQVDQAIKHLFGTALRTWYDPLRDRKGAEIYQSEVYGYYTDTNVFRKLGPQIEAFRNSNKTIGIGYLPYSFVNPVAWSRENRTKSRFPSRWQTLVHGDLHSGNIIVDQEARTYIIDYERTGRGYYLRDFVELEKDVRLRLLRLNVDQLRFAFYLDCLLLAQTTPNQLPEWRDPDSGNVSGPQGEELYKAFRTICAIRKAAKESGGLERFDEYYWALLMETLLTVTDPRVTGLAHQRALLSASMLCTRLMLWRSPSDWPPAEWKAILSAPIEIQSLKPSQESQPLLKLQLTDLHGSQNELKVAVLGIPNKEPSAVSALPYQGDSLIAVMKLLEPGGYQADNFNPKQLAALQQLELLQDNTLAYDWCDRIGHELFEALLPAPDGVRREFGNAFHTDRQGGELQITFDKDATHLAFQPWELLHDGFPDEPRTAIDVVRYIASGRTAQTLEVPKGPCQILYVTARPRGYAQPAHDRDAIKTSVASSASPGRFGFKELPKCTHQELKQRLMDTSSPIHVLHFDGHGTFARLCRKCGTPNFSHELSCGKADDNGEKCGASLANAPARGYLLFETDTGEAEFIDTTRFLEGIQRSEVRLVVLSSCQSARVRGADLLLAGVGPGLILAGVPAVVAMQFSISDQNAIQFNKEFYRALAQGDSLPKAVYRARTMLDEPARWSPVLYLRSRDHQIHLCPPK